MAADAKPELMPGTLDMLILRTIADGPLHGYAIARSIREMSDDVLRVEQGSLYPALYRMEQRGWISSKWARSDTKRRVKVYQLTGVGRRQLRDQATTWDAFVDAVARVMGKA